jgi:hypothetical protein
MQMRKLAYWAGLLGLIMILASCGGIATMNGEYSLTTDTGTWSATFNNGSFELTQMNTSDDIVEGYKGKADLSAVEGEDGDWEGPITDLEEHDGSGWVASTKTGVTLYVIDYLAIDMVSFYIDLDSDGTYYSPYGEKDWMNLIVQ